MTKIKSNIKTLFENQKLYIKKYMLTFICIEIVTLFTTFADLSNDFSMFYFIMLFMGISCFTVESLFKKIWTKISLYVLSLIFAVISSNILISNNSNTIIVLAITGLYLSMFIISIYKIISDSEITISQYLSRVFRNTMVVSLIHIILEIGLNFVLAIALLLVFKVDNYDIYFKLQILIIGIFYVPAIILSLFNTKEGMLKLLKVIICYIVLPIILIAEIIIYIYICKVVIINEIPKNQIFGIITGLYVVALPIWIMLQSFSQENKYIKYNSKIIPYSFIPLVIMQIYSLAIRINACGITPQRYLGIMLIVFEIATIIFTVIKEQKYLKEVLLFSIVLVITTMILPKINVIEFSAENQSNILKDNYKIGEEFDKLGDEQKEKAVSAYNYLKKYEYGKKYIPEYINTEAIAKYNIEKNNYMEYDNYSYKSFYYNLVEEKEYLIEGYKSLKEVYINKYYDENNNLELIGYDYDFERNQLEDRIIEVFMKDVHTIIEKDTLENDIIELDDNSSFIIKQCSIDYNGDNIKYISLVGFLLKK